MRKQEGSATATHRRVEPFGESIPRPSHPAFDRLEEMKAKQLKEVSNALNHFRIELRTTMLQDFDTLKKGFIKLRDKHTQSTAAVSALEEQLNTCQGESEQLKAQVTELQEQLGAKVTELQEQLRAKANEIAAAKSALHTVRLNILRVDLIIEGYAGGAFYSRFLVSLPTKTLFIDVERAV